MEKEIRSIIKVRRDITANWELNNPILADGELGFELNDSQGELSVMFKLGDGVTNWKDLGYAPSIPKGDDGYTPVKGIDYFDGEDGLSAYEIWLNQGNEGNVEDYLNSLKGSDVDLSNLMTISGGVLENYTEKLTTLASGAINLNTGNVFTHTLSGDTTYSITNAVNGVAHSFTLIITQTSTVRTLTFPSSVKWQGGVIPDLSTASKTYVLTFMTIDGGTNWLGMFGGEF